MLSGHVILFLIVKLTIFRVSRKPEFSRRSVLTHHASRQIILSSKKVVLGRTTNRCGSNICDRGQVLHQAQGNEQHREHRLIGEQGMVAVARIAACIKAGAKAKRKREGMRLHVRRQTRRNSDHDISCTTYKTKTNQGRHTHSFPAR